MNMLKISYSSVFLAGIIAFAGCHSNSTSPSSDGNILEPGLGSSFTLMEQSDTIVDVFDAVGIPIYGKSSTSEVIESEDGIPQDTLYFNYESNGDVSVYPYGEAAYPGINNWIVLPFGSQQPTSVSGSANENGGIVQTIVNFTGAGQGNGSVLGKSYTTQKVTGIVQTIQTITQGGQSVSDTTTTTLTYSFAPQLGYFLDVTSSALGYSGHDFLINYTLK